MTRAARLLGRIFTLVMLSAAVRPAVAASLSAEKFSAASEASAATSPAASPTAGASSGPSFAASSGHLQQSFAVRHNSLPSIKSAGTRSPSQAGSVRTTTAAAAPSAASAVLSGKGENSVPWSIVIGLTLLTVLPAILLAMTPMVRLLVVFHFLRQALGTQTAPSNQVLMGLALMMTWFLMQPVLSQVEQVAITPYQGGAITATEAFERGSAPVKAYMLRFAREKDLAVFVRASASGAPSAPAIANREALPLAVVVPAYMLSELKAGFTIGAVLFLPFLVVDLFVASITTSIGMLQLSPVVISTPVKILLFVIVDGWSLLADQLLKGFH